MSADTTAPAHRIHRAVVVSTERLTPGMIRIVLGGPDLEGFTGTGVGDEYVRLFLPTPGTRTVAYPFATAEAWDYEPGVEPGPMRNYTIRSVDPASGRATIDFVVHDGGVAASWAASAVPGDEVGFKSPVGLYDRPADAAWQVLLADATGLPAAVRLLEQAPADLHTRAVLEVASPDHEQEVARGPLAELAWVHGGNGHSPSRLAEILRSMDLPDGPGYVWVAGETRVMRDARKYLRRELGLPATAYKIVGYWTDQVEDWTRRYGELGEEFRTWLDTLWETEADPETAADRVEDALDARGL